MYMEINKVLSICKEKFTNIEEIVAIGIGNKKKNKIIIIMVSKKSESLKRIPKKIEGIEVEIREVGNIKAL